MREIKFRANIKGTKEIYQVQSLHLEDEYVILTVGEFNEGKTITKKLSEVNLMQYTGLKDKNGKEIYEGDIVNLFPEYDDMEVAYEILYNGCSFKINCGSTPYNNNLEEINYKIEIIGNIYENPELINN